jgi:hypothetical protein
VSGLIRSQYCAAKFYSAPAIVKAFEAVGHMAKDDEECVYIIFSRHPGMSLVDAADKEKYCKLVLGPLLAIAQKQGYLTDADMDLHNIPETEKQRLDRSATQQKHNTRHTHAHTHHMQLI